MQWPELKFPPLNLWSLPYYKGLKVMSRSTYSVFMPTDDDWYPSYIASGDLKLVSVSLYTIPPSSIDSADYRVCVWGFDDMGMELDLETAEEARDLFLVLISKDKVNIDNLVKLGFFSA